MVGRFISVILLAAVVLGLLLVPVTPVANVALAQPYVIGLNVTPLNTGPLGIGDSDSVVLWIDNPTAEAYSSVGIRMTYDPTVIDITAVTPNPAFTFPLENSAAGGLLKSDNAYLFAVTTTAWACQVDFDVIGPGISPLNFIPVDPLDPLGITAVMEGAADKLDWTMVANGSVTASCPPCSLCVDINAPGAGNVSIDGAMQTPPYPKCKPDVVPDHVFAVEAFPTLGYTWSSWTGPVAGQTNPTTVSVTGGATKNITANFAAWFPPPPPVDFGILFVGAPNPATEVVLVTNMGGTPLNWSSNITYDPGNPNPGWAGVRRNPISGGPIAPGGSEVVDVDINISSLGMGDIGVYRAYINFNPVGANVTVSFTLLPPGAPVREIVQDVVFPGDTVDVYVNWTAFSSDSNSLGLTDSAAVTGAASDNWDVAGNVGWCTPAATNSKVTGEQIEYEWNGPYSPGQDFAAAYVINVPGGAIPGVYNLSVDSVGDAWLEYYILETPAVAATTGEFQITVITAPTQLGSVYEVVYNWWGTDLIIPGATVDLCYTANGTVAQSDVANAFGNYTLSLINPGDYYLEASMAGFTTETGATFVVTGLEGPLSDYNFIGLTGLEPTTCSMSYALRAVNCWLYPPASPPNAALNAAHAVSVVNVWLATP